MSELRLTIGLPASGKSQYALDLLDKDPTWRRINWDNERKLWGVHRRGFKRIEEEQMQRDTFALAETYGKYGYNVIVDNTNLSENTRNKWKGVASRAHMIYTEIDMRNVSVLTCVVRDANREDSVGRAVIERMALFADLIKFERQERIVIVDMDGTVADCSHRRPYITDGRHEWDKFEGEAILADPPRSAIANLVKIFHSQGYVILIVSGRDTNRAGKHTVTWLAKYGIPYRHIFMRPGGDHRQDCIVKKEILDRLPKDQISYVLDDRDQVVKMWRENGLTCLQVAEGNF